MAMLKSLVEDHRLCKRHSYLYYKNKNKRHGRLYSVLDYSYIPSPNDLLAFLHPSKDRYLFISDANLLFTTTVEIQITDSMEQSSSEADSHSTGTE
jgi:hypothetical protein